MGDLKVFYNARFIDVLLAFKAEPFRYVMVLPVGRDKVYRKGLLCEIKRCFAMRDFKMYFCVKIIISKLASIFGFFSLTIF